METEFDFQEWALLAKESPEAFERRRREAIQHFLDASDEEQRRLGRSLQREIDHEIRHAGSPQAATTSKRPGCSTKRAVRMSMCCLSSVTSG